MAKAEKHSRSVSSLNTCVSAALLAFLPTFIVGAKSYAGSSGFDVNDVSILFPLSESTDGPMPSIGLGSDPRFQLMSKKLFKDIDAKVAARSKVDTRAPYEDWRVVAMRFDPCFPAPQVNPENCIQQVRLIVQPTRGLGVEDLAMHLLFETGKGSIKANNPVVAEFVKLKTLSDASGAPSAGRTLGVHPALALEAKQKPGPIARQIETIISKFCKQRSLKEVTFTDAFIALNGPWEFMGGDIKGDRWTPTPIPGLPPDTLLQETDDLGTTESLPAAGQKLEWFLNYGKRYEQTETLSEADIARLHEVENPALSHPKNTDCASCHMASIHSAFLKLDSKRSSNLFAMPFGVTGFIHRDVHPTTHAGLNGGEVVRVFGYFLDNPIATQLAANSSASVAESLNILLKLPPPTQRDCRGQEEKVRSCLLGSGSFSRNSVEPAAISEADCFAKYCKSIRP